jgi:hypothetical protein
VIINARASNKVFICCDWCDVRVVGNDFKEALRAFKYKADGRVFQKKGIFRHCCGKCRHSGRDPIVRRPASGQEDTLPVVLASPTAAQVLDRKKRRLDFDDQEVKAPVVSARKLDI